MLDYLSSLTTSELVVWSIFIGIVIGACSIYYNKRIIGSFVRDLIAAGACDKESAKTVAELGYAKNRFVRHALRDGSVLRKMVWEVDDNYTSDENGNRFSARTKKTDINTAHYYIDEENRIKADMRYSAKGTDFITLVIAVVVFFVAAYALLMFIPYIGELFGSISG